MNNTINLQLYSLIMYVISGIIIGLFFDVFRILRKTFKTPDIVTYIEDMLFWGFTGIFLLFILFKFNNGNIRVYILFSIIIGFIIYLLTISKYIININVKILSFIKTIVKSIIKLLSYPIHLIYKLLKLTILKPINFCIINLKKNMTNYSNKITNNINKTKKSKKKAYGKKDFGNICRKI